MQLVSVKPQSGIFAFTSIWIFATLSGFVCSLLLVEVGEKPNVGIIQAIIGALAIAIPQSYILKNTIFPLQWILSTVFAWVIITLVGIGALGWIVIVANFLPMRILIGIISGAIGGLIIGITQWWLAIPPSFHTGWRWIFINSAAWMIAIPMGTTIGLFLHRITNLFLGEVLGLSITWLLVAMITGVSAKRIIKTL